MTGNAKHNTVSVGIAVRGGIGGLLMGLANLVPGLSGGTMLLAVGVYPQFIRGVAEISTLRFRVKTFVLLACIIGTMLLAIVAFAGVVKNLIIDHRWIMYSLFIGLTLGGAPVVWRMLRPVKLTAVLASIVGILAMVVLVLTQSSGVGNESTADTQRLAMLVLAGTAAGGAMILPGVSGAYLFLILGQYVLILTAIRSGQQAVIDRNWAQLGDAMWVIVPVGVGVVIGVVGVSNLIKFLLDRFPKATLGFLLGLLLGAVVGLWPFQQPTPPHIGETLQGRVVTEQNMSSFDPQDWSAEFFSPDYQQVLGSLGLIVAGLVISTAVAHIGRNAHQNGPD
ncbi:MAG: undecaprenyl phosphate translocase family protein [Acidimicrobiia bacterium]